MFRRFHRSERGIALILTLIFLPVFIGVGLLVIDIGRGNNAQADHQAAADALALAGARELDGLPGARQEARAAMEELTNDVSFLGLTGSDIKIDLIYDRSTPGPFTVIFLSALPGDKGVPGNDDTPITQAFVDKYVAKTDAEAKYVYVYSQARDLRTFFFNPLTQLREDVPVAAMAVATLKTVTCDLTPLFMCNPFTDKAALTAAYEGGGLHGRMLRLRDIPNGDNNNPNDDQIATSGNIGFLRTDGNGMKPLAAALAGRPYAQCIEMDDTVETQPGAVTKAWDGFNTRFDVFSKTGKSDGSWDDFSESGPYTPAPNVRKGWAEAGYKPSGTSGGGGGGGKANDCARVPPSDIKPALTAAELAIFYDQFPKMSEDKPVGTQTESSFIRSGIWNLNESVTYGGVTYPAYWNALYDRTLSQDEMDDISSRPGLTLEDGTRVPPSRYDVYKWEVENTDSAGKLLIEKRSKGKSPDPGEQGASQCYKEDLDKASRLKRRTMLVAVVDCDQQDVRGNKKVTFDALAKVFLVNPGSTVPGEGTLDIEVVGLSTNLGDGQIDDYLKTEVVLVR